MLVKAVIPGPPQAKERPRVVQFDRNGRQLVKPRTFTPARTAVAEEIVRLRILEQNPGLQPTTELVEVTLGFFGVTRGDLDNRIKLILDAANGVLWKDDRQVRHIDAVMWRGAFGEPRTEIVMKRWIE